MGLGGDRRILLFFLIFLRSLSSSENFGCWRKEETGERMRFASAASAEGLVKLLPARVVAREPEDLTGALDGIAHESSDKSHAWRL